MSHNMWHPPLSIGEFSARLLGLRTSLSPSRLCRDGDKLGMTSGDGASTDGNR